MIRASPSEVVMITETEILTIVKSVSSRQLRLWVSQEWVRPARSDEALAFNNADLARIQMLDMLHNQLELGDEAIPVILSLIDQIHGLREQMRIVSEAIAEQPERVQIEIRECACRDPSD